MTLRALLAGALVLAPVGLAIAASFTPLGDLPGGEISSQAGAVADDGSVVVGESRSANGREAFRWTAAGGMVALGDLPGGTLFISSASDVSGDGNVVVGIASGDFGFEAFRWTAEDGMTSLDDPPVADAGTSASQMTPDGSAVAGLILKLPDHLEAFRWTAADGIIGLGYLPGDLRSSATAISANGQVVAGWSQLDTDGQAFRWTAAGGMVGLGFLPGGGNLSGATTMSGDGAIVFGYAEAGGGGWQAFRWTAGGGMQALGDPPAAGQRVTLLESSADGTVVVGQIAEDSGIEEAIVWTPEDGIRNLADVLTANGATIPAGWTLTTASAVSLDGRWVAGSGLNADGFEEAFVADLQPSGPAGSSGGGSIDLLFIATLAAGFVRRRGIMSGQNRNAAAP